MNMFPTSGRRPEPDPTPADLADIAGRLDALAAAERAEAPAGIESRIAAAAAPTRRAARRPERPMADRVLATIGRDMRRRLALAAGVLLAATAGVVLVGVLSKGPVGPATPGGAGTATGGASTAVAQGDPVTPPAGPTESAEVDSVLATIAVLDDVGGRGMVDLLLHDTERLDDPTRIDMLTDPTENTGS